MVNQFVLDHIQLGLFIHHRMQISSIFSIAINIVKNKFIFYPYFVSNKSQILDWYEHKKEIVKFTEIDNEIKINQFLQNYQQFTNHIKKQNPFIKNTGFIDYLKVNMKKDNSDIYFCIINKSSIKEDLTLFWGKSVESHFLYKNLEQKISLKPFEPSLRLQKI